MAGESKTEKASPKKRKDERKKGNTFSSKDVISLVSILGTFYTLKLTFPLIFDQLTMLLNKYIGYAGTVDSIGIAFSHRILLDVALAFAICALPVMAVSVLTSVVATGAQTRFLFSFESLKPRFNRLNPLQGLKRMLSMKSMIELLKSVVKIVIIGYILYSFFSGKVALFSQTLSADLSQSVSEILNSVIDLVLNICMIFVFLAALDYLYQWWDYEKQLRMSKHEVKEEYKQMEGDPQLKGKIKERQRRFAMSRMMQAVPTADVIIRNPTHYAVALRYVMDKDGAPVVVAKGADEVAMRIIKVASEHDIHVIENRELTRAIYAAAEINSEIPIEFYGAVAEILALVYQAKQKQI